MQEDDVRRKIVRKASDFQPTIIYGTGCQIQLVGLRAKHKFVHAFRHGGWPWLGVTQLLNVYKEFCCRGRESEKVVQELKSTRIRQRCGEPVGFLRRRRCDWKSDWGYPNQNLQSARQNTDTHICEVKCDLYTCWWLLLSSLARSLCECVLKKNVCGLLFTVQIFWL